MKNKTVIITGASRGIGKAIGLRLAQEGANIVSLATDENPQRTESDIVNAGGQALVLNIDVTDAQAIEKSVNTCLKRFGSIDILINNTSATHFRGIEDTTPEIFDTLMATSVRAALLLSRLAIPHLKQSGQPHILNISPPIHLDAKWFAGHTAFTLAKYAMSLFTIGLAAELEATRIKVNSLWPESTIATQTIKDHLVDKVYSKSRWPAIMADAAYAIVSQGEKSGCFLTDEGVLRGVGMQDFSKYAVDPEQPLMQALFTSEENDYEPLQMSLCK